MKTYTKDELINMSVGDLMNIILSLQSECEMNEIYRKQVDKIAKIIALNECSVNADNCISFSEPKVRKRKNAATPESRRASYEKQLARQKAEYWELKKRKQEEAEEKGGNE